jgi:hypothetical protein
MGRPQIMTETYRGSFELNSGRRVRLISLQMFNTYGNRPADLLPSVLDRDGYLKCQAQQPRGILLLRLPQVDPEPQQLPVQTYVADLRSMPIDPDADVSALTVVWCGGKYSGSLDKYVEITLRDIDWVSSAKDLKY